MVQFNYDTFVLVQVMDKFQLLQEVLWLKPIELPCLAYYIIRLYRLVICKYR